MPKCKHHHNHKHADKWTNISTIAEAASSFISDTYWLASVFDVVSNLEAEAIGLSYYGAAFGCLVALLSASGAAYSHRRLNTHHQTKLAPSSIHSSNTKAYASLEDHTGEDEKKTAPPVTQKKAHLTAPQKLALAGDFISHIGDIAGPITFVVNLATNNGLVRWGKAIVQCGASLFGGAGSIANVRTCKNAMLENNTPHQDVGHSHDNV